MLALLLAKNHYMGKMPNKQIMAGTRKSAPHIRSVRALKE
jgi:hypothetical protein